jgi:endonuclease I
MLCQSTRATALRQLKNMRKKSLVNICSVLFLFLSLCSGTAAQDSLYYSAAFNKSDDSLKYELNQLIKGHTEYTYTSSSTDVWDILKKTDRDPENPDNVILLYSGRSVNAAQEYNSGSGWSREHVWAKSRGDFGNSNGPGTDAHHLRPCDISVNSTRNNRNFDDCVSCIDVIDNGFNTGSKRDANFYTFEPRDEVKGDVARMIFYMAVRYEGEGSELDLELTNTLLTNTDQSPLHSRFSTLLEWSKTDVVSDWERNRNNIIDSLFQHNRNPFIDHPELSEHLWGDSIGIAWTPAPADTSIALDVAETEINPIKFYPNPTTGLVHIEGEYDEVYVFDALGKLVRKKTKHDAELDMSEHPSGLYFAHMLFKNTRSAVIKISKR